MQEGGNFTIKRPDEILCTVFSRCCSQTIWSAVLTAAYLRVILYALNVLSRNNPSVFQNVFWSEGWSGPNFIWPTPKSSKKNSASISKFTFAGLILHWAKLTLWSGWFDKIQLSTQKSLPKLWALVLPSRSLLKYDSSLCKHRRCAKSSAIKLIWDPESNRARAYWNCPNLSRTLIVTNHLVTTYYVTRIRLIIIIEWYWSCLCLCFRNRFWWCWLLLHPVYVKKCIRGLEQTRHFVALHFLTRWCV